MSFTEKIKQFFSEAKNFDSFFCLTAIVFGFLDRQDLIFLKKRTFPFLCFQLIVNTFMKALLAEVICFITWKTLLAIGNVNTKKRGVVLCWLAAIHVIWIYFMNLCFICMLSKLDTVTTWIEFFLLLTIVTCIIRGIINILKCICSSSNDVENSHSEISTPIPENIQPLDNDLTINQLLNSEPVVQPMNEDPASFQSKIIESTSLQPNIIEPTSLQPTRELLSSTPNSNPSIDSDNVQINNTSSGQNGLNPHVCSRHATLKSPVHSLRNQATATMTNDSCKIVPPSPPNDGPSVTNNEWQTIESKTRSGCVYRKVKVNRSSNSITMM